MRTAATQSHHAEEKAMPRDPQPLSLSEGVKDTLPPNMPTWHSWAEGN